MANMLMVMCCTTMVTLFVVSSTSLSHMCLHIEAAKVKFDKKMSLPEYSCLALSPANLWQQNREKFQEDSNLLGTIYTYQVRGL
jgi:hypothetical protein